MARADDYLLEEYDEIDETGDQLNRSDTKGDDINIDNEHIRKLRNHIPCCIVLVDQIFPAMMLDKSYCPVKVAWETQLILHRFEFPRLPKEFTDFLKERGIYEKFSEYLITQLGYQAVSESALNDPRFIEDFWRVFDAAAGEIRGLAKYEQQPENPHKKGLEKRYPIGTPSPVKIPREDSIESDLSDQMQAPSARRRHNYSLKEKEAFILTAELLEGLDKEDKEIFFGIIHRYAEEYVAHGYSALMLKPTSITRLSRFNVSQKLVPREMTIDVANNIAHYKGRVYNLTDLGKKVLELLGNIANVRYEKDIEQ